MGIYWNDKIYGITWYHKDESLEQISKIYEYKSKSELKPHEILEIKNNYQMIDNSNYSYYVFKICVEASTTYEIDSKPFLMWLPTDTNFLNDFFNIN